ncbi:MAG TPA: exodeoxyribonuclease V subunit gamma [Acidimicrobiales bacterium]|nr:exodeoxyribonuclease V subunit gamma [Acidimicrobiales bacterium]
MLHLHRSARADYLAAALGDVLAQPPPDPLQPEVVSVPTRGVERWLAQELSHRLGASSVRGPDGICANITWPFPGTLVASMTSAALREGHRPARSQGDAAGPWVPDRAVWPLVQVLDDHLDDEPLAPVAAHLRAAYPSPAAGAGPRRFAFARHVADLFDRYAVHRPEMLLAWAGGPSSAEPEFSEPGWAADVAWQSYLWRLLRRRIGVPSPAEEAQEALGRLRGSPDAVDLPGRVSCFGLTRLPASYLRALVALATHREVHLFLLHPSPALWDRAAQACAGLRGRPYRSDDPTAKLAQNPLCRSWGRDAREMQVVLAAEGAVQAQLHEVPAPPATLLGLLQANVYRDSAPPPVGAEDARVLFEGRDGTLTLHSCHGRARQVEVTREAVLHLLAADPTLEPRDVIIMCPDIEQFAPLVTAVFETAGETGAPAMRARLADRSVRQTNPMLAVAAHLLELAGGRATASQLLDFASREPVRRRFGLDEDDLGRLEVWLAGSGVRWGVDATYRQAWKLGSIPDGTWRAGLDRLLLGVAMNDEDRLFAGVLPYEDIGSSEFDLVGRVAELVNRLSCVLEGMRGRHDAATWAAMLADGAQLLACPADADLWQTDQLRRVLSSVAPVDQAPINEGPVDEARLEEQQAGGPLIDWAETASLLADKLQGRPTRANFRTGDMTVCTLVPMRSVPHRVVCLLGMDDGVFPRHPAVDGDDLMLAAPMVGDRDGAGEDRQLLLDALLAATDHLVITYEGRDQHLNQPKPPCVPIAELLDAVDRTVRFAGGLTARDVLVVEHPLQAFDARNYQPGALGPAGPWRFDSVNFHAARKLVKRGAKRERRRPFLEGRLAPSPSGPVDLAMLVRFLEHPARAFLRARLGYYPGPATDRVCDSLNLELAPLERWAVGDRLLSAVEQGRDLDMAIAAELGRGLLPPGPLAKRPLAEVSAAVKALLVKAGEVPGFCTDAHAMELAAQLPGGRSVMGSVPRVAIDPVTGRATLLRLTYSKLAAKHRLRAWAQFLALGAAFPDLMPSAITVGQSEGSTPERPRARVSFFGPLGRDAGEVRERSVEALGVLVDLYDRGMREPLPIYCATSAAWAEACMLPDGDGPGPKEAARQYWQPSNEDFRGEAREPEHMTVLGTVLELADLLEALPADDEGGPGWDERQETRFGRLSLRLWAPLLAHEHLALR